MSTQPGDMLGHYRLGDRLGQGGMGVVFRALDTRLNRSVAIKVLTPEVGDDRERRLRFRREAQAAAALNHPNIAVIHEVGEQGDTDFIVMEFIAGRTLGEHAGGRPLPLREWMRVALALAEGVAHAHRQGVIHRDLKPENVMVTDDGQVKILDFGLAKLLEPPGAEPSALGAAADDLQTISRELTLAGKVYGTIPYMSPEQVRGERVDQRSDLFSLGVLLYEMAGGRSPFKRKTGIETLHSILTFDPPPLAASDPETPAEVDRIVRKAMEKEPEHRYQDAADLAADLRSLRRDLDSGRTTTTRPLAAVAGPPPDASAPWNATGTAGARSSAPSGRRTGLRAAILGGSTILVLLAVAGAWMLIGRAKARPEPPPTPGSAAAPTAEGGSSLAVMYFENVPDPDDRNRYGQMVTSLLITDLSQTRSLHVVSRQRLFDTLRLLGKENLKLIDASVASEVALKAGVPWMLTGSILQTDPNIVLSAEVSEANSGRVLVSQRVAARPGETIFAAVDQLGAALKHELAPADAATGESDRPIAQATTASPEAYRAFLDGLDAIYRQDGAEARRDFQRAVALDSTFAMAHYMLAINGRDEDEIRRELGLAVRHIDRVTGQERFFIRSFEAQLAGHRDEAVHQLEELVRRYPDEKAAYIRLAGMYGNANQQDKAIDAYQHVLALDPLDRLAWNGLAYAYDAGGQTEKSLEAINKYIALAPDEANPYDTRGDLYAERGEFDQAEASYRDALSRNPDFAPSRGKLGGMFLLQRNYAPAESCFRALASSADLQAHCDGRFYLALVPAFRGRLNEAIERLNQGLASDELDRQPQGEIDKLTLLAALRVERGEFGPARQAADRVAALMDKVKPRNPFRGRDVQLYVLLRAGAIADAGRKLEEIRGLMDGRVPAVLAGFKLLEAGLAVARGDTARALACLRETPETRIAGQHYWRGYAYLHLGHYEEAVHDLELAFQIMDQSRVQLGIQEVKAHYWLGLAYEKSGWGQKAAHEYREFLAYWQDGDPGLPQVKEAKEALARLAPGT